MSSRPGTTKYDPTWVREHYDAYGMKEWHRWERTPSTRIAFAVHVPGSHELMGSNSSLSARNHRHPAVNRRIVASGDLDREMGVSSHYCHMYRAEEFRRVLEAAGLTMELLSATDVLFATWGEQLRDLPEDGELWQHLLELELEACREPGCVDMREHIMAVCRKLL